MNGRHRRVDPNEPKEPNRRYRPRERLTEAELDEALAWLLVSAEDPDVDSISANFTTFNQTVPSTYVERIHR